MGIEDDVKVKLAAFRFIDRARFWWKDTKARLTTPRMGSQEIPKVSWKKFEDEFNDKYFPKAKGSHVTHTRRRYVRRRI